jgi:hypothetical protein
MEKEDYLAYRIDFYRTLVILSIPTILVLIDYFQWFNLPSQLDGISRTILFEESEELFFFCCSLYLGISMGISWARGWPNSPDIQLKNKSKEFVGNTKTTIEKAKQKLFVDFSEFWKTTWFIGAGIFSYLLMVGYFGVFIEGIPKYSFTFWLLWLFFFAMLAGPFPPQWIESLNEWIDGLDEEE